MPKSRNKLTAKQEAFVYCYTEGLDCQWNAAKSVLAAGYAAKGADSAKAIGHKMLTKVYIQEAIEARKTALRAKCVATRQQRQQFWTDTYQDKAESTKDRLRSSELLGKSQGDFVEQGQQQGLVINIGKPPEAPALPVVDSGPYGTDQGQIGQPARPETPQGGAEGSEERVNRGESKSGASEYDEKGGRA